MRFFCAAVLAIFLMGIIEALAPIDSTNSESSSRSVPRFVVGAASRRLRFQDAATMEEDGSDDKAGEERTGSIPSLYRQVSGS
ncbi:hypothetical protein PHYSODRAFT_285343 [Phytophthora sojae]|uniref:RxLR effector protein n=2 Tax=Phytophthora sojae TaxID=67593 RepID=G4ZBJ1_PHYSP|nr:hypothetical protein PHYSODRAFT_285343 [Phytophthora sojae]AEK81315.1 Avh431 [Phytophthora sojae]AEK81317.1 Avh431 [Phytophthora sojae]EGZ19913.1 hypothetical protein PHYSODRAFT_285343 [Phytophthora sojae]|eukprot:XP_009522630.1 hypothetical protein PHYSODRAFT_285343 [Phytophthora sojae]